MKIVILSIMLPLLANASSKRSFVLTQNDTTPPIEWPPFCESLEPPETLPPPEDVWIPGHDEVVHCLCTRLVQHIVDKMETILLMPDGFSDQGLHCASLMMYFGGNHLLEERHVHGQCFGLQADDPTVSPTKKRYLYRKEFAESVRRCEHPDRHYECDPVPLPLVWDPAMCPAILDQPDDAAILAQVLGQDPSWFDWRYQDYLDTMTEPDLCALKLGTVLEGAVVSIAAQKASNPDFLQVIPLLECFYAYTIEGVNSRTSMCNLDLPEPPPGPVRRKRDVPGMWNVFSPKLGFPSSYSKKSHNEGLPQRLGNWLKSFMN